MASNEVMPFGQLKGDQVNYLVPPKSTGLLCGVKWARQDGEGVITLCYLDDSEESAPSDRDLCKDFDSFFSVVQLVQNARRLTA